jgi:hypothetical protein
MKVVVSCSCKYADELAPFGKELTKMGITLHIPKNSEAAETDQKVMKDIILDFYKLVDDCDLMYIYAPNGYIGKSVANEIGYAYAKKKQMISSEPIEDYGISPLVDKIMSPNELIKYIGAR